jgi:hypothetical protein
MAFDFIPWPSSQHVVRDRSIDTATRLLTMSVVALRRCIARRLEKNCCVEFSHSIIVLALACFRYARNQKVKRVKLKTPGLTATRARPPRRLLRSSNLEGRCRQPSLASLSTRSPDICSSPSSGARTKIPGRQPSATSDDLVVLWSKLALVRRGHHPRSAISAIFCPAKEIEI